MDGTRRSNRLVNKKMGPLAKCSSKAVASRGKTDSNKEPTALFEARRSSGVKTVKNKTVPPDLLRNDGDEMSQEPRVDENLNSSSIKPGKNIYYSPLDESSHDDNKLGKSQSKAKRRLEFIGDASSTPIAKDNSIWLLSPVESSCKRSRSGRLILPPLDFWRNQRAIYDMGRQCVGVLNGLPSEESLTGNILSGPSRKKKKYV